MIKPTPPPRTLPEPDFVACDIENRPDGSVFWIETAWRDDGEIQHVTHQRWQSWWGWLTTKARADERFRTIYAHNGGGWDWLSLAHYLLNDGENDRDTLTAINAGSKMVVLIVAREKKFTIRLCDSLQLLRSSLDKLSQAFLGERKIDLDGRLPFEVFEADPELFKRYARGDVDKLLRILENALALIREHVAPIRKLGYTIGSTSLTVFKTTLKRPISIPWRDDLRELLREGYTGGRVEVFESGYHANVSVYDVNSLYPAVMRTQVVPVSDRGYWVEHCPYQSSGGTGAFRVRFVQHRRNIPPLLCRNGMGAYSGDGTFFSPELDRLLEIDPDAEIQIDKGFHFIDNALIFGAFVDRLYALRVSHPGAVSLLCKYLLNSLYGKFGQHTLREKLVCVHSFEELFELVEGDATVRPVNEAKGVYLVEQQTSCGFEHVGIAGVITSGARVVLYNGILAADRVCYCDTDSVHVAGSLSSSLVGPEIGAYKLEFTGEAAYAGKKLYALRDATGEKIRAKGICVGGRNGCRVTFSDIVRIAENSDESILCVFQRPATALQTFAGKDPCKFEARKRRLKLTHHG